MVARDGEERALEAQIEGSQVVRRVARFDDVSIDELVSSLGL